MDSNCSKYLKYIFVILAIYVISTTGFLALLTKLVGVISPFVSGAFIAYVINQLLIYLEKAWDKIFKTNKKSLIKRGICILVSFVITISIVVLIVINVVPELRETAINIKKNMPEYVDQLQVWSDSVANYLTSHGIPVNKGLIDFDMLKQKAQSLVLSEGGTLVNVTLSATTSIFSSIVNLVLALVFSVFLLADKETLTKQFDKLFKSILKKENYDRLIEVIKIADNSFSSFITGQLLEAIIIGCLCFIGMFILGMPYKGAISVLVGFTALIPMVGAFIGTAIGAFLILFVNPSQAFWFIVFIIVLQQFEGNLIYPKVVGKSVGLPGIWVLVAIAVGGGLFGVFGMILSVPIASIIYELTRKYVSKHS